MAITPEQALDVHNKLHMAAEAALLAHYMNGQGVNGATRSFCDDVERHFVDVAKRLGFTLVRVENNQMKVIEGGAA